MDERHWIVKVIVITATAKQSLFRASSLLLSGALAWRLVCGAFVHAVVLPSLAPAWASPSAMALQKVGDLQDNGVALPTMVENLDCQTISRPLASNGVMQSGCFMSTAFGALDVGNGLIGFNGTDDHVVPLLPFSAHELIWPWPGTIAALAIDAAVTDGAYLNLYTNILGSLSDRFDLNGTVIAKQITAPPNRSITDNAGNKLIVNANSLTFSSGGSWLVVETLTGSFVRINLATLDVTAFAPSFISVGSSPGLNESQLAVSRNGRFIAVANAAANSLRVYDLSTCRANATQKYQDCASYNYWPFMRGQLPAVADFRHLRFLNDGLLSLIVYSGNNKTSYELAPTAGITALTDYLALGDSYTSGEGASTYLAGTDTPNNSCHLSAVSYPLLLTHHLFTSVGGHSVACTGAATTDVIPLNSAAYPGQVKDGIARNQRSDDTVAQLLNDFSPGYLAQSEFVSHYQPRVLTVSIAGNDIGFGDILEECVAPHLSVHLTAANNCYATYEDRLELAQRIDREVPKLTSLFKQLRASSPSSGLYIVGYPQIAVDTGNCALNVHLNTSEIALSIEILQHLNAAISQAAEAAGGNYVDISQALAGHRLCETASGQVAVNGLTAGTTSGITVTTGASNTLAINFLSRASYHPNVLGHELIERAILQKTNNFSRAAATSLTTYQPAASDSQGLLKAPKSGRATRLTASDDTIVTNRVAAKGSQLQIKISGEKHGLKPGSGYRVSLGSGALAVGNLTTTNSGDLVGTITLPTSALSGAQTVTVSGDNQLNQPISITTVIYVIGSSADYDSDGVPNESDSCPTVANSGVDADQDGIDDACDGEIGVPPSSPTTAGATGGASTTSGPATTPTGNLTTPSALEVTPVIPIAVIIPNAADGQTSTLTAASSVIQNGAVVSALKLGSLAINTGRVTPTASLATGQASVASVGSNGSMSVLGGQAINPDTLPRTTKLQTADNGLAGQVRRLGGIRVIDWLPWARVIVIALFLLLLASALLGRQLQQTAGAG